MSTFGSEIKAIIVEVPPSVWGAYGTNVVDGLANLRRIPDFGYEIYLVHDQVLYPPSTSSVEVSESHNMTLRLVKRVS